MDRKTILLVEDDSFVSDIYQTKISSEGFDMMVAENGLEAIKKLEEKIPDLILLDIVMPYVHERKQFGQAIGNFQFVQGKIADMYVTMNACKAYVYAVAKSCDRGETTREDAAGAILIAAEKATQTALDAIQLLGGNGYINDYPTGRLLRDAKLYEIGAGTSEIRRMLIGRELFEKTT